MQEDRGFLGLEEAKRSETFLSDGYIDAQLAVVHEHVLGFFLQSSLRKSGRESGAISEQYRFVRPFGVGGSAIAKLNAAIGKDFDMQLALLAVHD